MTEPEGGGHPRLEGGRSELARAPAHVVVRDFPETLAVFRRHGTPLGERGGEPVGVVLDGRPGLLDELEGAVRWRRAASGRAGGEGADDDEG